MNFKMSHSYEVADVLARRPRAVRLIRVFSSNPLACFDFINRKHRKKEADLIFFPGIKNCVRCIRRSPSVGILPAFRWRFGNFRQVNMFYGQFLYYRAWLGYGTKTFRNIKTEVVLSAVCKNNKLGFSSKTYFASKWMSSDWKHSVTDNINVWSQFSIQVEI